MSDGNRAEDAAAAMGHASPGPPPASAATSSNAPDQGAPSGVFATFMTAIMGVTRPMNMASILNTESDEVVASSDQDGDQASPTKAPSGLVAVPTQLQHATERGGAEEAEALGQDDAAAGLLMGLAISATEDDSTAMQRVTMEAEMAPSLAEVEDVEMAEAEAAVAEEVEVEEPRRDKRGRVIRPRPKAAKSKAKAVKKPSAKAAGNGPATSVEVLEAVGGAMPTELPVQGGAEGEAEAAQPEPLPSRTREKRRTPPPPAPVQVAPSKKTRTAPKKQPPPPAEVASTSSRPKRNANVIRSYSEIMLTEEDEDEDEDVDLPMVIATENVKASRAEAAAEAAAASATSGKKTLKRKTMSQRQFDELMSDNVADGLDDLEGYEVEEIAPVAPVLLTAPGVKQRPCEFCHLDHSAFTMFYCHSCRRMYHGKCLVDAFRPGVKEGVAIEDQMETLTLYRPGGHASVLRCVSCQAAFIDLYNRPEVHRDCTCFTCVKSPQKTADYRRVSLKMIVDQHNEEFALKKGQKGGKSAKKPAGAAAPTATKTPAAKPATARAAAKKEEATPPPTPAEGNAPSGRARGSRSTRRTRDSDEPASEEIQQASSDVVVLEPELPEQPIVKPTVNKAKVVVSVKPTRRARARASQGSVDEPMYVDSSSNGTSMEKSEAMEVDSAAESQTNGPTSEASKLVEPVEADDSEKLTVATLDQLFQIVKDEAGESWTFRVACSPSGKVTESGKYKEAMFVWHPSKDKELECRCCKKGGQSLRWFVDHTDPSLITSKDDDPYAYIFAVRRDESLTPLSEVVDVLRRARSLAIQRRSSGGSEPNFDAKDEARKQALAMLLDVAFKPIVRDRKRRSSNSGVAPEFMCEVVCAEGRYLSPLVGDDKLLRCSYEQVSVDVWRRGHLEVRENPTDKRTSKIHCDCCLQNLTTKQFREHLQKELESARNELPEGHGSSSRHGSIPSTVPIRSVPVAMGVRLHQQSALRMDRFFWAVDQLGSQAEINKAIAEIIQSHG